MSGIDAKKKKKICVLKDSTFYVYQTGKAENSFFFDAGCYRYYLNRLFNCLKAYRQQLHTYVLLPGELHLLISAFSCSGLIQMVRQVNSTYADYFANRFDRQYPPMSGNPVCRRLTGGNIVLDCQKYIELLPVQNSLADRASGYFWSGYSVNAYGGHGISLTAHRQYRSFFEEEGNGFQRYRDFIEDPFTAAQQKYLEQRLRLGFPLAAPRKALRSAAVSR
jgi:putative transposase